MLYSPAAIFAMDPNQKLGPAGVGQERFVSRDAVLGYRVDFENEATATAPAQIVMITDPLDSDLDLGTFELTGIGFGDRIIDVPEGLQHFATTVPMSYQGVEFEVQIEAGIRADTGGLYVNFISIDPAIGVPPAGLVGFLPPEDNTGRGQGHVSYTVRPKAGLPTGREIRNVARIQFDFGETIGTNQVDPHDPSKGIDLAKEALNTIDAGSPTSEVADLPPTAPGTQFLVQWSGQDDAGGSGIRGYDVFVSIDGGAFSPWIENTTDTSRTYTGEVDHTYTFHSVATDNVGHREAAPPLPDAETSVRANPWCNAANPYDVDGSGGDKPVTPLDVLIVINYINAHPGSTALPASPTAPPPYYDVNDDGLCTPLDVLTVINYINAHTAGAGEAEAVDLAWAASAVDGPWAIRLASGVEPVSQQRVAADRSPAETDAAFREDNDAPVGLQLATRSPGEMLAHAQDIARRGVWEDGTLEELDTLFSLWDALLPDIFDRMTDAVL
jgi:hypothetical protein